MMKTSSATALRGTDSAAPMAMALFLVSETVFFLTLILAFCYVRATAEPVHLLGGVLLDPTRTGAVTALLVASSFTYMLAERGRRRADVRRQGLWLALTVLFGASFLAVQAIEYRGLWQAGFVVDTNVFTTSFYTLTGIHFLHVAAGLAMLGVLLGLSLNRDQAQLPAPGALRAVGYYWHFVDVVWLTLFTLLYLLGT